MILTKRRIDEFRSFIFSWWKLHRRDLPWRHTNDSYKILVSEVMLQQTQVLRVIPKYAEFIEAYPTLKHLSRASIADVLRIWKGMGYNRRALYLAKIDGIPPNEKELMKLPGIGKYTARAIMVFAFKKDVALVDTNIRKILTHFFFNDKPQKEKIIQGMANSLVPKGKSWEWHQALMDYGALALPKIPGVVKKQKKFEGSSRYFRGKAIDELRNGPSRLADYSDKVVASLVKDGLIAQKGRKYVLPT